MPPVKDKSAISYNLHEFEETAEGITQAILNTAKDASKVVSNPKVESISYICSAEPGPYTGERQAVLSVLVRGA